MKISSLSFYNTYPKSFTSNARCYTNGENKRRGTMTDMFRDDLNWKEFTNYMVNHFKNKEDVNFIQFASSDGSEAYTQIITLLENHQGVNKFFPIQAYDIDEEVYNAAKSGVLNINKNDEDRFANNSVKLDKYFNSSNTEMYIDNDGLAGYYAPDYPNCTDIFTKSYKVSKQLTEKVDFHHEDMYDILLKHEDKSNTILMCRNVMGYFDDRQLEHFTDLVARKLKKGSLFIIGEYDTKRHKNIDLLLQHKGFIPVMEYVYRKSEYII